MRGFGAFCVRNVRGKSEPPAVDCYEVLGMILLDVHGDGEVVCPKTHSLQVIGVAIKFRARNPAEIKQLP